MGEHVDVAAEVVADDPPECEAADARLTPAAERDRRWQPQLVCGVTIPEPADVVGRAAELRYLDDALERVARAGGSIAVHGAVGVGKSALLDVVQRRALDRDYLVLTAAGVASETAWPLAGLHQLMAPLLGDCDALPQPQRTAIRMAFGGQPAADVDQFLVGLAALHLVTSAATQRPVVLLVDDVHRLDRETRAVLAFLTRRVGRHRILIVTAARTVDDAAALGPGHRIALGNLDETWGRELLRRHGPTLGPRDCELILSQAMGNPLALVELPAAWSSASFASQGATPAVPMSARLEEAFGGGLDALPARTRDLLLIAALTDEESTAEILAAAGALSGTRVDPEVVDAAVDAGLVRSAELRMEFRHPLVRSAVLQAESTRRRQAAHLALADVLADDPARSTWHRAQAIIGFDDDIADDLEDAHTGCLRPGPARAIGALERASQLTSNPVQRGRRLLLAAEQAFALGRVDTFDRLFAAASRNVLSEQEDARSGWLREIFHDGTPGDAARVTELCGLARRTAEAGDGSLGLDLLVAAALRCWWADAGQLAPRLVVAETQRLIGAEGDPRYALALALAEPVRQCRRVQELLARFEPGRVRDTDALRLLGQAAHAIGDPVRALAFLDRAAAGLREEGRHGLLAHVLTMGLSDRLDLGSWDDMADAAAQAERLAADTGQALWQNAAMSLRASAAGLSGDVDRALGLAAQVELFASEHRLNDLLAQVQLARGHALMSSGQPARAYRALRRLFDPADPCHHGRHKFRGVMDLAQAASQADQTSDARAVLDGLEAVSGPSTSPTLHHQLAYARALLADDGDAERLFRTALDADLTRWPLIKGRLELAFGSWLRRQRHSAESRDPLRSAFRRLDAIGASYWAGSARRELRAAGENVDGDAARLGCQLLSAQEREIARLVAEGLTNKQIGERLYLSPRTVGSHLYHIFPKLDVTSRGQLAARLRGE